MDWTGDLMAPGFETITHVKAIGMWHLLDDRVRLREAVEAFLLFTGRKPIGIERRPAMTVQIGRQPRTSKSGDSQDRPNRATSNFDLPVDEFVNYLMLGAVMSG
jgi:hypothetical protein